MAFTTSAADAASQVFHPGQKVKVTSGGHRGATAKVAKVAVRDRSGRVHVVRFSQLRPRSAQHGVRFGQTITLPSGRKVRVTGLELTRHGKRIGRYDRDEVKPAPPRDQDSPKAPQQPSQPQQPAEPQQPPRPSQPQQPQTPTRPDKPTKPGPGNGNGGGGGGGGTTPSQPTKPTKPTKPTDPGTTDPGPSDPGPSDPGPSDPGPSDPDPGHGSDPGPSDPGSSDPDPDPPVNPPVDSPFVFGGGLWPGPEWRPYSASSPFNTPVVSPVVSSQSDQLVANSLGASGKPRTLIVSPAPQHDYQHPIYYAKSSDPMMTIQAGSYAITGMAIRVPATAVAAGGGDGHIAVVQPDGWSYELWQVSRSGSKLVATAGYRQRYDGPGIITPADYAKDKSIGGSTAPYFGLHAGIIRASELAAGQINHALFITIPGGSKDTSFGFGTQPPGASGRGGSGSFVWPALKGDAVGSGVRPPMGARFWLDMTDQQIAQSGAPGWEKAIALAVAHYGAYFGDTGGDGLAFQAESSVMYTSYGLPDPYETIASQYGIRKDSEWGYGFAFSGKIPWSSKLRVIAPPSH